MPIKPEVLLAAKLLFYMSFAFFLFGAIILYNANIYSIYGKKHRNLLFFATKCAVATALIALCISHNFICTVVYIFACSLLIRMIIGIKSSILSYTLLWWNISIMTLALLIKNYVVTIDHMAVYTAHTMATITATILLFMWLQKILNTQPN